MRIEGQSEALGVPIVDRVVDRDARHDLWDKLCVPLAACLLGRFDKIKWCKVAQNDRADLTDDYIATGLRLVRFRDKHAELARVHTRLAHYSAELLLGHLCWQALLEFANVGLYLPRRLVKIA